MSIHNIIMSPINEKFFWSCADKGENNEESCWDWQGRKDPWGYGHYKDFNTPVLSYLLSNGIKRIPKDMCVCHKCDNPSCINPRHLYLGTHKDNMIDKHNKGRDGSKIELCDEIILKIYEMQNDGNTKTQIAKKLKLTKLQVDSVFNRPKLGFWYRYFRREKMLNRRKENYKRQK